MLPEPDFRLLGYLSPHSEPDTSRMHERAHYEYHQDNPRRVCENPNVLSLVKRVGFWERLRV